VSLFIESLDGNLNYLEYIGLQPLALVVDSLSPRTLSETLDGRDGHIDLETTYEARSLKAYFKLKAKEASDYIQFKNSVHKLFDGKTYFYVIDEKEQGKRWKVRTASKFNLDRINPLTGKFEVDLISSSPYCESYVNTLSAYNPVNYTFSVPTFQVRNEGDIPIDPRELPLTINFKGASNNLIIRNLSTGDEWNYTGTTIANDNITLDGIRSLKNGFSIFGDTNKKLITIGTEWNEFEIVGAVGSFEISFDFRYYYI
jgi:hypothetical protein